MAPVDSTHDLLVVGGGPAGISAARAARDAGLAVVLVDERPTLGGQIYKQPGPGFTNVLIRGGKKTESELLASIDHGLLVEGVIGMGQGNTISGAFSNTVNLAYLVEKGEVVGRVRDVSIAGNSYEVLKGGIELGRDPQTSFGSMRVPALLVAGLSVVGK